MDVKLAASLAEHPNHLSLNDIAPERQEGRGTAVYNERSVLTSEPLQQGIVTHPNDKPFFIDQIQFFGIEGFVLSKRAIDRIAVNATHVLAALEEVFREPARNDALPDAALP